MSKPNASKVTSVNPSSDPRSVTEIIETVIIAARKKYIPIITDSATDLPLQQIFEILESSADEETKLRLKGSALRILGKIEELTKYEIDHKPKEYEKFENYVSRSIEKLIGAAHEFVFTLNDGKLQTCTPSWNIPITNHKVSKESLDAGFYQFEQPGKTTGEIFLKQKGWIHRDLPRATGFIIGIVNCNTVNEGDSRVSTQTLGNASIDDLEVFDTIHELERIYTSETQNIGLSTIKINRDSLTVESDNKTTERILSHVEEQRKSGKDVSSIAIFIVSESFNLSNRPLKSIGDIYSHIPFRELKEIGVDDIMIDVVSCNTSEIARDLIELTKQHSAENQIKVSSVFHNGYIFNNITYCYLAKAEYKDLVERKKSPDHFYESPDSSPKSKQLVQIITPGLSNIFTDRIADYTTTKDVAKKSKKCLIPTQIPFIPHGSSFIYSSDERMRVVEVGSETAAVMEEEKKAVSRESVEESIKRFHAKLDEIGQGAFQNPATSPSINSPYEKIVSTTKTGSREIY